MQLKERINQILQALAKGVYEKDEIIRLSLLAAIAGESAFLLGPPGVAKSLIARRLKFAFKGGKSFEYLMNKFSTPDEIFGPVSIKKLKEEDKYERRTANYMPGASVVFLDEIWKASISIQNALLTILNEKIYRNGEEEMRVDIKGVISASNELPPSGEGLEALWDRFLVRYIIQEIQSKGNFVDMITNTDNVYADNVEASIKIDTTELDDWQAKIDSVVITEEVLNTIQVVKHKLDEYDNRPGNKAFAIYDRRWKKIINLMRTSAFLNGRAEVDLMDCFLMVHCLWSSPDHIETLQQMVSETIRDHGYNLALNLAGLKKEITEMEEEVKRETRIPFNRVAEDLYLIDKKFYELLHASNEFEGRFVKHNEFDRLGVEDYSTIGLYDNNFKLTYKIRAKQSANEHEIEIYHNSKLKPYKLKTHKVEKTEFVNKRPHEVVLKYWGEKATGLRDYIIEAKKRLETDRPEALENLRNNLFVDSRLAGIVEANMNDSLNAVNGLELRLEKIVHYYSNLEE